MKEIWKDVIGFEDSYQVSNLGNVKAKSKITWNGKCNCVRKEKPMRLNSKSAGYNMVNLKRNGKIKHCLVHRLVADAFIPNKNNKPTVNHIDGNKLNNIVSNLEWATRSEQNIHASKLGLKKFQGVHHSQHKLNDSQVIMIRHHAKNGDIPKGLDYGVSDVTIKDVINRRSWKHI
jgi:hypothetical protein